MPEADDRQPRAAALRGTVFRRWLVFLGVVAVMALLDEWASFWVNEELARLTAAVTAFLLRLAGAEGEAVGTFVQARHCSFEIIGECTAYYPCALYIAAVLAYPTSVRARLQGLALGVPALLAVNQLRLVSLCWVHGVAPEHFETAHVVVWQSLIMFATVLLWLGWLLLFTRHDGLPLP